MPSRSSPTIRMRRLARALADYRAAAGLTQSYAAERLGWSLAKLVRLEGARVTRPSTRDIEAALDLYGIDGAERTAMIDLTRRARERGWWLAYREVLFDVEAYVAFEDAATSIRAFHGMVVPGLLQCSRYAAAIVGADDPPPEPHEAERRVAIRMMRGLILERPRPPRYQAILTEGAIRQRVGGPEVMREQIDRIVAIAGRPNVDIRLLPFSAGPHLGMAGPFTLLDYADPADPPIAYCEGFTGGLYIEDEASVADFRGVLDDVERKALGPRETIDALATIREEFD